jgi:hypothetical protein
MPRGEQPRHPHSWLLTVALLLLIAVFVLTFDRFLGCLGLGN